MQKLKKCCLQSYLHNMNSLPPYSTKGWTTYEYVIFAIGILPMTKEYSFSIRNASSRRQKLEFKQKY